MKPVDRFIQTLRLRQAVRRIPDNARVLDIGSYDGRLFELLGPRLGSGVAVDPHITKERTTGRVEWRNGSFPDVDLDGLFDCICMLAVVEHIPRARHDEVAIACARLLGPGGRLIVTMPSPIVDPIAGVLARLKLIDGIDLDQHYQLHPREVVRTFSAYLRLVEQKRFEFGLNHLMTFERSGPQESVDVGERDAVGVDRDRGEQER